MLQGEALGPAAAMDAALARLNRAEEDVAALREAIKVDLDLLSCMQKYHPCFPPAWDHAGSPCEACTEAEHCPSAVVLGSNGLHSSALMQAAQARARMAMPKKKKKGEDSEEANPVFEVPAEDKLFKGDPNDRKALLRHKQHVKACSSGLMAPHAPASSSQLLNQSAALQP